MNPQIITKQVLDEFGVDLEGKDVDSLLQHLNETLEERVGAEITESLDDDQLKALLDLQESGTDEQVGQWLEQNVPELQQITQDEIDILIGELAENTDGINEAA
ncbi:MAG TPA: DUF5663 domain-containing protein [Candidatus Saccharimonadales bacterium]